MNQREKDLLQKLREIIKEKQLPEPGADVDFKAYILTSVIPVLQTTKDIQSPIYDDVISGKGIFGKLKKKILDKIANVTRNVVERSFTRQQKFNNSILQLFEYLVQENIELTKKLDNDQKKS
ncbi:MAG: hypothetical protein WCJ58_07250 [bacterium]